MLLISDYVYKIYDFGFVMAPVRKLMSSDKKLIIFLISFLLAIQVGAYLFLRMANRDVAMESLDLQLNSGARAFGFAAVQRGEYLKVSTDLLSRDYGFMDAVGTGDRATIESALENQVKRLNANGSVIVDLNGKLLGKAFHVSTPGTHETVDDSELEMLASKIEDGKPNLYPLVSDGTSRLYKWTRTIVKTPKPVAVVYFAFEINEDVIKRFKRITNFDFMFMSRLQGQPWEVHTSSSDVADSKILASGFKGEFGPTWTEWSRGQEYRVLAVNMNADSKTEVMALVSTPFNAVLRPFDKIEKISTVASIAIALCSIFIVRRGANKIVSPLAEVVYQDPLTGLANRRLFEVNLGVAAQNLEVLGRGYTILQMDLNKFKVINDTLGHAAGDLVLIQIAKRLKALIRSSDTVARLGGDEFVILLLSNDIDKIESLCRNIVEAVKPEILLSDARTVSVGISIGIARAPANGRNTGALLDCADGAMYKAKQNGCGFCFAPPHALT